MRPVIGDASKHNARKVHQDLSASTVTFVYKERDALKIRGYEFSVSEFAGALGDFGPLNPFLIGYIAILGVDPVGLFLMMGIANIIIGLIYNVPLSVEAKKAVGIAALADNWTPSQLYAVGVGTGFTWIVLALSGLMERIAEVTPKCVVRGIQLSLAVTLALESVRLSWTHPALSILSVLSAILLLRMKRIGRYMPAALFLFIVGLTLALSSGALPSLSIEFRVPPLHFPSIQEIMYTMIAVGFAQIFLTLGNAVIATAALCRKYYPRREVKEKHLALNMGLLNAISPFFGGVPLCHGADGVASQYMFGARTGGAMILEGIAEVVLSLFLASHVVAIFKAFPQSVIGAMLLLIALELVRVSADLRNIPEILVVLVIIALAQISNLGMAFLAGVLLHYLLEKVRGR